jgi:SAM-dependent methyltransferase
MYSARECLMREWNAETYHRVSTPQFDWGTVVLSRLPLEGNECVLDVGCGTGRLTERVLARLPRGRVVGIDQSSNMVRVAREYLQPHGDRIHLLVADASAFAFHVSNWSKPWEFADAETTARRLIAAGFNRYEHRSSSHPSCFQMWRTIGHS